MAFNNIHKLYLMNFLASLHFFGAVSIPFFLDWIKVDYTKIFILEAWFMFWIFVLEIPTGFLADKYGRKFSLLLSLFVGIISSLIFGLVHSYYALFIAEFLAALTVALSSGAQEAFLYDSLYDLKLHKKSRYFFARLDVIETLGMVIAFPLGSWLVGSHLFPYPGVLAFTFLLTAGTAFLSFLIALTLQEPKKHKIKDKNFITAGITGFKYILQNKSLRAFALNSTLISATTFFIFWFYQPLAGAAKIPIQYYGFIGAGFNVFGVLLLHNIKRLEKIFSIRHLLLYTAFLPGLFFIGVALSKQVIFILVGVFIITGSKLMRGPILADFMNKNINSQNRATVLSGISMVERALTFILYPIIGLLADISLNVVLIFLGIITLLFAVLTRIEVEHLK